jgi:hypothetical protein
MSLAPRLPHDHQHETARTRLEQRRWGQTIRCPLCWSAEPIYHEYRKGVPGYYRCRGQPNDTYSQEKPLHKPYVFTVRTGTIMQRSHIALSVWERALALVLPQWHSLTKRPTAFHLSLELELTEKSLARLVRLIHDMDERFEKLLPVASTDASRLEEQDRRFLLMNSFLMTYRVHNLPPTQASWFNKYSSPKIEVALEHLNERLAPIARQLKRLSLPGLEG